MKKLFITSASIVWILSIILLYFFGFSPLMDIIARPSHGYYINAITTSLNVPASPLYKIAGIFLVVYLALAAYKYFYRKRAKLELNISPFYVILAFSAFFGIVAVMWLTFYKLWDIPAIYPGIAFKYTTLLAQLLLIVLVTASLGSKVLSLIFKKEDRSIVSSFGLGSIIIIFLMFLLGLFGLIKTNYVLVIFALVTAISWKEAYLTIYWFFKKYYPIKISYFSPIIFLIFTLFFVISHNLLEVIRPMPIGFDDLGLYMIIPKLISENGTLLSGMNSYSWGIFMSLGFLLFRSVTSTMFISLLGGFFAFFGIYKICSDYFQNKSISKEKMLFYPMLLAVFFYTLPTAIFQSAKDMKVDLAALFFICLSLIFFIKWKKSIKEKLQKPLALLFLSMMFLGFAFSIKYTAVLFLGPLLYFLIISLKRARPSLKTALVSVFIFFFGFGLPFLPYAIKNVAETKTISISSLASGKSTTPKLIIDPPIDKSKIDNSIPIGTGAIEELDRYIGYYPGLQKYLLIPFTLTFNPLVSGMYVDIGYIFLAFIPLIIFFGFYSKRNKERSVRLKDLLIMSLIYWGLWLVLARGIIWYGFGGFIFLLLILGEILLTIKEKKFKALNILTTTALALWFICILFLRSTYLPSGGIYVDNMGIAYAHGMINEAEYMKIKTPVYIQIYEKLNAEIKGNPENPPKIYRVGTFIKYFIAKNDSTVLDDHQLDAFISIYLDRNPQKTAERMKNSGFKYIIIDTNTASIDKTPEQTLAKKYTLFMDFIKNNPDLIKINIDATSSGIIFAELL